MPGESQLLAQRGGRDLDARAIAPRYRGDGDDRNRVPAELHERRRVFIRERFESLFAKGFTRGVAARLAQIGGMIVRDSQSPESGLGEQWDQLRRDIEAGALGIRGEALYRGSPRPFEIAHDPGRAVEEVRESVPRKAMRLLDLPSDLAGKQDVAREEEAQFLARRWTDSKEAQD